MRWHKEISYQKIFAISMIAESILIFVRMLNIVYAPDWVWFIPLYWGIIEFMVREIACDISKRRKRRENNDREI